MKSVSFFILFLVFLAACTVMPPKVEPTPSDNKFLENAVFCNVDADCTCGGIDRKTDNCFVGNKLYASKNVDMSRDCPDFCTGIAAHLETKCVANECKNVQRPGWNQPKACTEEAKVCPDGSAVGRTGPNCEFSPCPGEEPVMCTADVKECPDGSYVSRSGPNCEFAPCGTLVGCTKELKICPDGTGVGRTGPNCEFEPCPETSLSSAHWLCDDGSWKNTPEGCFNNYCVQKGDCQLLGVTGLCGPYKIAGPTKTLHKPPVLYKDRCGQEPCSPLPMPMCIAPESQPRITGFDCEDTKCVVRTEQPRY